MATEPRQQDTTVITQPTLTIYTSELRVIAGLAAHWGELETGGELHG